MLGQVGSHLQRAVHRDIQGELAGQRGVDVRVVGGRPRVQIHHEDARRIVHRAALQAGEGQDGGVRRLAAAEGLVLRAAGGFITDEVGPGAAQARGAHCLVGVDHDVVLGGFLDGIEVVVHHPLAVVVLAIGQDVAYVTALHGVVAILDHQFVGIAHVTFVVADGRGGLVVHHQTDALVMGVFVQPRKVKVGIGGDKVEDVILHIATPVFPANIPAFYQHLVETVGSGEVDILLHVLRIGRMHAVGLHLGVVRLIQLHRGQVPRVGPGTVAGNHLPPDADVLHGLDPGSIFQLARLVEVEDELGGQDVAGIVAHHHRAPGATTRGLQVSLVALRVGCQPGLEHQVLVVQVEVHARVVHQGGLVQVDVKAVVGLQLQGGLHSRGRKGGLGHVAGIGTLHQTADFGQAALGVVIFLRVVVSGNPPGGMVARHGKLRMFLLDDKVHQVLLPGELVAQAHAVVVDAEADVHIAVRLGLTKLHQQFVIVVADVLHLAPDRLPGLVKGRRRGLHHFKTVHQVGSSVQLQTQATGFDDGAVFVVHGVGGHAAGGQFKVHIHDAGGGRYSLGTSPKGSQQ